MLAYLQSREVYEDEYLPGATEAEGTAAEGTATGNIIYQEVIGDMIAMGRNGVCGRGRITELESKNSR